MVRSSWSAIQEKLGPAAVREQSADAEIAAVAAVAAVVVVVDVVVSVFVIVGDAVGYCSVPRGA